MDAPLMGSKYIWIHLYWVLIGDGSIPNGMLLEIGPPLTESYYTWIHLEWNPIKYGPPLVESD
eukprot:8016526-Pyramimonas_sp.AAC.1